MFLKEIHVKNFKGFDDLRFSFTKENGEVRKHTILLGENGTGKSNLLKAIALITAEFDAIFELLKQPDEWIKQDENTCTIEATTIYGDNLKLQWSRGERPTAIIQRHWGEEKEIPDFTEKYKVNAYGAFRKLSLFNDLSSEPKQNYEYAKNIANLFDNEHVLYPITKWLIALDYNAPQNEVDKQIKEFALEKLNACLQDIKFERIDKKERILIFKENGKSLPLKALSDGYQNMAAFIGDLLARRYKELKSQEILGETFNAFADNFNCFPSVMLIDELDLHLHPKWQRALLDFLARELPSFQIIATTHSPLTAQQAGEGELFTLKKAENGGIMIIPFSGSPDKMLVGDLLTANDAFGLKTTESLKVEMLKARYKELKNKEDKTTEETAEWNQIIAFLNIIPNGNGSAYFSTEHYQLLQTLKAELNF